MCSYRVIMDVYPYPLMQTDSTFPFYNIFWRKYPGQDIFQISILWFLFQEIIYKQFLNYIGKKRGVDPSQQHKQTGPTASPYYQTSYTPLPPRVSESVYVPRSVGFGTIVPPTFDKNVNVPPPTHTGI